MQNFANKPKNLISIVMLRLNRIKPQGRASRKNARSDAVSLRPESPVMKARAAIGAD
jgi:hypothetical protein